MKSKFTRKALVALLAVSALVLSACSSGSDDAASGDVKVTLITKDQTNPFFVAMIKGAEAKAAELGVDLTVGLITGPITPYATSSPPITSNIILVFLFTWFSPVCNYMVLSVEKHHQVVLPIHHIPFFLLDLWYSSNY